MVLSLHGIRWWRRAALREAALLGLTVTFGLQTLRVLLPELVFNIREALGGGDFAPGVYALVLFLTAFLAGPMHRLLGPGRALVLTAGGLALMRVVEQVVVWPVADLGLATIGTALFLSFIPTFVGHVRSHGTEGGHIFAAGLLLGIGLDTAIKGVFATLDLSWQPGVASHLVVILLASVQVLLLIRVARDITAKAHGTSGFLSSIFLVALGPVLFLELLLFQNIGQQTSLIRWDQPVVFTWMVMANAVGMVVAMGVMARPSYGIPISLAAFGGLLAILAVGEQAGLAAAMVTLFGQVALSMAVGVMGLELGYQATREDMGGIAVASGVGMMMLFLLMFLYYGNYQFAIPGGPGAVPPIAAAMLILVISGAIYRLPKYRPSVPHWAPVAGAALLLALPLGYLVTWRGPESVPATGYPVRIMSYNLHQGFDVDAYLAIEELAKTIKEQRPDVVALQEVSRGWVIDGSFDMLVWLSQRLGMPYVWGPAADSVWGNAILSRYPMSSPRTVPMPNNSELRLKRSYTTVEIDVGDEMPLTVINTHLHNLPEEGDLREPQVRALIEAWDSKERAVVLGDLNALPEDAEMLLLADAGLKDAFVASSSLRLPPQVPSTGDGTGPPDDTSDASKQGYTVQSDDPAKRIDYIWISRDLEARGFSLTASRASDHLGVAVTLATARGE